MLKTVKKDLAVIQKKCQLEENKICDNCCECYVCDLDPNKICDNCARCITAADYTGIMIDDILLLDEGPAGPGKKRD
ncbi:MAG: hypothetical protein K6U74_12985 [Firmicutes bacterium]|nr:hypothetical protein [Bacillota bacterium]